MQYSATAKDEEAQEPPRNGVKARQYMDIAKLCSFPHSLSDECSMEKTFQVNCWENDGN